MARPMDAPRTIASRFSALRFGVARFCAMRFCALVLFCGLPAGYLAADETHHSLWEIHGKHNTVYLLGSIHVLRPSDYPLAAAVLNAYGDVKSVVMEINLEEMDGSSVQTEMMESAMLPEGKTLSAVMGERRYARAQALAHEVGMDLANFEQFAPWFVAEAISQLQLAQMGFEPQSGVEMFFLGRARGDGKPVSGLETAHDQIALFTAMSEETQAQYLLSSLEEAHDLPKQVNQMVHAWQRGDTAWFESQMGQELGRDPALYQSLLAGRNRKWLRKIEAMLGEDKNYLIIVGTGHLVGINSVLDLLKKDGFGVTQR